MLQFVQFDEVMKNRVVQLERECEKLCQSLEKRFEKEFSKFEAKISIELLCTRKGKRVDKGETFSDGYESFIEVGIFDTDEYFPNAYIPIWKCKKEMFQEVGYLTRYEPAGIAKKLEHILAEIYLDWRNENTQLLKGLIQDDSTK